MANISKKICDIFNIDDKYIELDKIVENKIQNVFNEVESIALYNSCKVAKAFENNKVSEMHLGGTTGYGYNDRGREVIEKVYADIFEAERALVRIQFVNGTHTIATAMFGNLSSGDVLLSISGAPYDTLMESVGSMDNKNSLVGMGVIYKQIDLVDNDFDKDNILEYIKNNKVKMIFVGRSRGYTTRESLTIDKIKNIIEEIKKVNNNIIVMVDNCYGEFVEKLEPTNVGADLIAGSLIKNIGGSLAETGGYIVGKKEYVEKAEERFTAPGIGGECGATFGKNKEILQGLYIAPTIVMNAIKTAIYASSLLEGLGYKVNPKYNDYRTDIIQSLELGNKDKLISFIQGIQHASPIDSHVNPEPWDMPGYSEPVIMAAGTFVSGASIELSADSPIKAPYVAYIQGGITYETGKISILRAVQDMEKKAGIN